MFDELVRVEMADEVARGADMGGEMDFELDAAFVRALLFVRFCNKRDCLCSHGGLYSFCSTRVDEVTAECRLLLSIVVLALDSLNDLFDFIELFDSSPRFRC